MKLGKTLKRLRLMRKGQGYGSSIEVIEIVSKIPRSTISRIERGSLDAPHKNLATLSELYGIPIGEILLMSFEEKDFTPDIWGILEGVRDRLIIKTFK